MTFKCFNIKFTVSYLFAATVAVYTAIDKTGMFIPLLLSIIVHETAHSIALCSFGCRITEVKLAFGCVGIFHEDSLNKWRRIIALFAGPTANMLLSAISYFWGLKSLWGINFILAAYNMLPLCGLDGGSIFSALLNGIISENKVILLSKILNITTLLAIFAFVAVIGFYEKNGYSLILFAIYLLFTAFF